MRYLIARRLSLAMLFIPSVAAADVPFTILPYLPGFTSNSSAVGVSDGGAMVVGTSNAIVTPRAWRWTPSGGIVNMGTLPGLTGSISGDVTPDGAFIAGSSHVYSGSVWRWSESGGMQSIGVLPGWVYSRGGGISADGSVIVGLCGEGDLTTAFRWSSDGGMTDLAELPGDAASIARDVSQNGRVAVGWSEGAGGRRAVLWDAAGVTALGLLPGAADSAAYSVNATGDVIAGLSTVDGRYLPFRWTEADGMQPIPLLPGSTRAHVAGMSADGNTVVGQSVGGELRAYMWTAEEGTFDLTQRLLSLGFDLGDWTLTSASGVSSDGLTVIGIATRSPQPLQYINVPFVVTLPSPSGALVIASASAFAVRRRSRR